MKMNPKQRGQEEKSMLLQIAWRNIWRNPRRTMVIMTAIVIGIWSMVFLSALMRGMGEGMIANGIATLTGHIQIHHKNYRRDPVIDNSIGDPAAIEQLLQATLPPGSRWTGRIRINGVASNARHAAGITLVGIDPRLEASLSFIGKAVKKGRYLTAEDSNEVLVGRAMVDKFETRLGHKLVLMAQDTTGEISSRAFRITGIFEAEMEATEKEFIFIPLVTARKMLGMERGCSEIAVLLPLGIDPGQEPLFADEIDRKLESTDCRADSWQNLLPFLSAYLKLFDGFVYIWFVVVFIAMGFGIVNTTLMAIFERIREFGLMKALGLTPARIIKGVMAEAFVLLVMGMAVGNTLGLLSVAVFSNGGIDLSRFAAGTELWGMSRVVIPVVWPRDIWTANLVVLLLGLLVSIYPAAKAARFTPVEALAHT
jgi:ABC-type lipoprotein release transport system permease subunit